MWTKPYIEHILYIYIVHVHIMKLKGAESTDHCNPSNDINQKKTTQIKNLSGNYQIILNIFSIIIVCMYLSYSKVSNKTKNNFLVLKESERNVKLKRKKFLHNFDNQL